MAIIEVDGTRIAYDEFNGSANGGGVVLLHAFPLNRLMWQPQTEELRGVARFVAPDMRGFGSSDVADSAVSMERMADDVHALVESLEIAPVALVGLSMGGYVALAYMRKYGDGVRGLVLADTNAHADDDETKAERTKLIERVAANGPASAAEAMIPKLLSEEGAKEADIVAEVRRMIETTSASGIVAALHGMANRPDSTELLGSIEVPTLVIVGDSDASIGVEKAQKMADAIPGARLEVIEGAGHLSNLEKPGAFNDLLRDFLEGLSKKDATSAE